MASSYSLGVYSEQFVRHLVKSGRYASASEVMRDDLRLIEEREAFRQTKIEALRHHIAAGLETSEGQVLDMAEIKSAARAGLSSIKSANG